MSKSFWTCIQKMELAAGPAWVPDAFFLPPSLIVRCFCHRMCCFDTLATTLSPRGDLSTKNKSCSKKDNWGFVVPNMMFYPRKVLGNILSLAFVFSGSEASIRIVDSGLEFRSWPDKELGPRLALGELYTARLQMLKGNSHLCLDHGNWNVTVPDDGSPGKCVSCTFPIRK